MKTIPPLYLQLRREYFIEILAGRKTIEYRDKTDFYARKLFAREWDRVRFRNGYHNPAPEMIVALRFIDDSDPDAYELHLGKILWTQHIDLLR